MGESGVSDTLLSPGPVPKLMLTTPPKAQDHLENAIKKSGWMEKASKRQKFWSERPAKSKYFQLDRFYLRYFDDEANLTPSNARKTIDLRNVISLRPCTDPSAPPTAFEVCHTPFGFGSVWCVQCGGECVVSVL